MFDNDSPPVRTSSQQCRRPGLWTPNGPYDQWIGLLSESSRAKVNLLECTYSADRQVRLIEGLAETDGNQPWVLSRQASLYISLGDVFGAYAAAVRAQGYAPHPDATFDRWVNELKIEVDKLRSEEDARYDEAVHSYGFPAPVIEPIPTYQSVHLEVDVVDAHWASLRKSVPEKLLQERLSRLISIESTQLEHVFMLGGNSVARLVRAGFFVAAIEKVQESSPIRSKRDIIRILMDYHLALEAWGRIWTESKSLDERMIKEVHHRLLRSTRVRANEDDEPRIIPTCAWRQVVARNGQRIPTIYHRPSEIPPSMSRFFSLVEPIISAARSGHLDDPYTAAAWIHHSLACIHPFEDGNGRVTRIVASIPLVLCGLPPINVFYEDRSKYGECLRLADTQRNIAPLATFLRDQAEKTASRLLDICEADTDPDGDVDGGLDTFIGKEYEKAVATGPVSLSP